MRNNLPERDVIEILNRCDLPSDDITALLLPNFFGLYSGRELLGIVGIELHGTVALLRSLAVIENRRKRGVGGRLLGLAEEHAAKNGVKELYLLTTNAASYFQRRGYEIIERGSAPDAIKSTTEFSSLCPASATLMRKLTR